MAKKLLNFLSIEILLLFTVLFVVFCPILISSHRFVLLACVNILGIYLIKENYKIKIKISEIELSFLLFTLFTFFSFLWAIDPSLVWYNSFGWLLYITWLVIIKNIIGSQGTEKIHSLFSVAFFVYFLCHVLAIAGNLKLDESWNSVFGNNWNYSSALCIVLFPFSLFSSLNRILKVLSILSMFLLLIYLGSIGNILILFTITLIWILTESRVKFKLFLIFVIGLLCFVSYNYQHISQILLSKVGFSTRIYGLLSSWYLFLEYPVLGLGFGNWEIFGMKYNTEIYNGINTSNRFYRYGSHNLFGQILAELGIIGFLFFIFPFIRLIHFAYVKKMTQIEVAASVSIIAYIIISFFYRSGNLYYGYFGGLGLIGFTTLGIFSASQKGLFTFTVSRIWFMLGTILGLFYYIYIYQHDIQYREILVNDLSNFKKTLYSDSLENTINTLEDLYNPIFYTTYGNNTKTKEDFLLLDLARLYLYNSVLPKDYSLMKAEKYFQLAIVKRPFDNNLLAVYSKDLLFRQKKTKEAKDLINRLYQVNPNYWDSNLLKSEIAILEKDCLTSKWHLDYVKSLHLKHIQVKQGIARVTKMFNDECK